jgi:ATP-dependent DNA ligase
VSIADFVRQNENKRVTSDIEERWNTRIVANGWDRQGERGAQNYLRQYGRSIGVAKCVKLAIKAESVGLSEFARPLWEHAYFIDTGVSESLVSAEEDQIEDFVYEAVAEFPENLQPGLVATLQPQDGGSENVYITDDEFVAQEKIDGVRALAFVTEKDAYFQGRSTRDVAPYAGPGVSEKLRQLSKKHGNMVLDGEMAWIVSRKLKTAMDFDTNYEDCRSCFFIFDCLYIDGEDLTKAPFWYRFERLSEIDVPYMTTPDDRNSKVYVVPVSETTTDKRKLFKSCSNGKEGVVFRDKYSTYIGGKKGTAFRVKFSQVHTVKVLSFNGKSFDTGMGKVSSGLTTDNIRLIRGLLDNGRHVEMDVECNGLTKNGRFRHPRVASFTST